MKKSKTWIRDAMNKGEVGFYEGQKVVLYRKKLNGYPKFLEDGKTYRVKYIYLEDLVIEEEVNNKIQQPKTWKINKTYLIPKEFSRDFLIQEILKEINE